ncbi:MAG: AraC family transcriptional regulator [Flavobacteriales bacterium]|nr:AraC family transcriptional regulator [Flavobacteriales bacterium]
MKTPENYTETEYIKRINEVFTYIEEHLQEDLSLEKIARKALFSPFHFHRIFKIIVGETLNEYITRKRLQKAANRLIHDKNLLVASVAVDCGFGSHASFSRAFKKKYDMSPTDFYKKNNHRKMNQINSNNHQILEERQQYICTIVQLKKWITMNANIEVKEMKPMKVAYITCIGVGKMPGSFERLIQWGAPKGYMTHPEFKMATLYHDSFKTTESDKVRMSACMVVHEDVMPDGEIGTQTIPGGKMVVSRMEIGLEEFEKAWTGAFIWLNDQGYEMAEAQPFEIYQNDYRTHPENKFILDICIPIK